MSTSRPPVAVLPEALRVFTPPSTTATIEQMGRLLATFSIAARDPETGMLGVAVSSKALAAGAVCPFVRAGVGAVATQAWVNPFLGPRVLDLLELGRSAEEAAAEALGNDRYAAFRQLNVVSAAGDSATFTGDRTDPWCGGRRGPDFAIAGNILVSEETVAAMEAAFLSRGEGDLADRLVAVLEAGQAAGGDARGRQSAAVVVVHRTVIPFVDLRVDDHPDPVSELRRLHGLLRGEDYDFLRAVAADEAASEDPEDYPD